MDSTFWNKVYDAKAEDGVSWYQDYPASSLETIFSLNLPKTAKIIDVGGGRSKLSACLYEKSYTDLTVLDISDIALSKLKEDLNRTHPNNQIKTLATNIATARLQEKYDLWHDRAVFHFLTNPADQEKYTALVMSSLRPNGHLLISTFSRSGPKKCSGLEVCQYDDKDLAAMFSQLTLIKSWTEDHRTPFETTQNFTYCLFQNRPKHSIN